MAVNKVTVHCEAALTPVLLWVYVTFINVSSERVKLFHLGSSGLGLCSHTLLFPQKVQPVIPLLGRQDKCKVLQNMMGGAGCLSNLSPQSAGFPLWSTTQTSPLLWGFISSSTLLLNS